MLVLGLIGVPAGMALVVVALYNPSLTVYLLGSAIAGAVGVPPVLLTLATHLTSSRSALIGFSAIVLAISITAAWLQAAALRH